MLNVKDFGAIGNGIADDSNALQAAIDSLSSGNGQVYLPTGVYVVTRTIVISKDRVKLTGDGIFATTIRFGPSQEGQTCLRFAKSGNAGLFDVGGEDFTVFSGDTLLQKTGIELIACIQPRFVNVMVKGSYDIPNVGLLWTNALSPTNPNTAVGWHVRGDRAGSFINCSAFADSPLRIGVNPGNPNGSVQHYHWHNWYSIANNNFNVEIETGVILFNITFDGFQAWVSGLGGLRWVDTTSVGASQIIRLENVRAEQYKTPDAWIVYIDHNSGLYGLQFNNSYGGMGEAPDGTFIAHNGIYTRNVVNADLQSINFTATGTRTFYDTEGKPGHRINMRDISCKPNQIAKLANMRLQQGQFSPASTQPVPWHAVYTYEQSGNSPQGWARLGPGGRESTLKSTAALGVGASVNLECGTATGHNFLCFKLVTRGATKSEGGSCFLTTLGMFREMGTLAFETFDAPGKVCLFKSGGNVMLKNNLNEPLNWFVFVVGSP